MKQIVILLVSLFSFEVAGQNHLESTLLWRISGNGLRKPSYLYGTMHLRDKRVFNFADSVLMKFDECEAFSLEIDLDSAVREMIMAQYNNNEFKLKNYLGREEYEKLRNDLASEAGINSEKLKNQNPFLLRNFISALGKSKEDMPTFLDAYLYNLARENGKQIMPLENVSDQVSLLDKLPKNYVGEAVKNQLGFSERDDLIRFIESYTSGNLTKLDEYSHRLSDTVYNVLFTKRNYNMCKRIEGFLPLHNTFIIVGAGHLPGTTGLITLLRKKGYTISPILPTYKGLASKFKSKKLTIPWKTVSVPEDGYSVEMPSDPIPSDFLEVDTDLKLSADAGTGLSYFSTMTYLPELGDEVPDEQRMNKLMDTYWKEKAADIQERKTVLVDGKPLTEILLRKNGFYFRTRLIYNNHHIYLLMAGGTKEAINQPDANRFLNSIRFFPQKPKNWKQYTSQEGAYTVYFPENPKQTNMQMPIAGKGDLNLHMTISNDNMAGIQYLVQYFEGKGFYYPSDSAFFESSLSSMKENFEMDSVTSKTVIKDGFKGKELTLYLKNSSTMLCGIYLRGCRAYNLLASLPGNKLNDPNVQTFFSSFHFTDYQDTVWQKFSDIDSSITTEVPAKASYDSERHNYSAMFDSTQNYVALDKNSGFSFYLQKSFFGKYYYAPAYDSILNAVTRNLTDSGDTVVYSRAYTFKNLPAKELLLKNKARHTLQRCKFFINDSALYLLFSYLPEEYLNQAQFNRFFESVDFTSYKDPGQLLVPKTRFILNALKSEDSATYHNAVDKIYQYTFTKEELPLVYEALLYKNPLDTGEFSDTRSPLFDALKEQADSSYLPFIASHYDDFKDKPQLQAKALEVMAGQKNATSRKQLLTYLLTKTPDYYPYSIFMALEDSAELNVNYFPDILRLLDHEKYTEELLRFTAVMLEKKCITRETISDYIPRLIEEASRQTEAHRSLSKTDYTEESLIKILGNLDTPDCRNALLRYLDSKNDYDKLYASMELLRKKIPVKPKILAEIASTPGLRSQLYARLDSLGETQLFPAKYYTQQYFAESDLWNYFSMDEDEPAKIELKAVKELDYKGEKKRFYVFKVSFDYGDDVTSYFGVSGPYSLNSKKVITSADLTGSDYSDYDEKSVEEHLKDYLKE